MNLAQGEKIIQVMIANKAFGEINPGPMKLQQLELAVKMKQAGMMEGEMKVGYETGTSLYKFPELDENGLERVKATLKIFAAATNQPGVFREYDFSDCRNEEEMRFRLLLIPEYRAVTAVPRVKLISLKEIKEALRCPVCRGETDPARKKCPECGAFFYKDRGLRYFESERASFFPLLRNGAPEATVHLCKVDFINVHSSYFHTHITYIEELPIYLGAVYTLAPAVKPVEFRVILNKPRGIELSEEIFPAPYSYRKINGEDLELLYHQGVRLFCGIGTEPHLTVSFPVWDYTCMEEIGSHVNYILSKYNRYLECLEGTG